jgi:hypothetical protein
MKIIVAGSNTRDCEKKCIEYGVPKLYSILNEKKQIEEWNDELFLMVDSGAHSWNKKHDHFGMASKGKLKPAEEFIEDYFKFIQLHKDKKVVWVEFDVYNDLPKSVIDDFYKRVMDLGIAGKFIRVYHHYIDPRKGDYSTLEKWVDEGQDYIGLGADNIENFDDIFSITKDVIKTHGFALTRLPVIEKYPFFSVDSTSPLSTVIFGRYTRPIMGFNERADVFKAKSIECYDDDWQRLEKAIIETKKTEEYITELWKQKGIIWADLKY